MITRKTPREIIGNRRIRAIALDIDGTIVDEHEHMPSEIRSAISGIQDLGMQIVFCTARSIESVLELLSRYFSKKELCAFAYITLNGSHAYRVACKGEDFAPEPIFTHPYDPSSAFRLQVVRNLTKKYPLVIEKQTSLLVDVGDPAKAKRHVRQLNKVLTSSRVKTYQYHSKVCISLKRFDKDNGLREYLKFAGIANGSVIRIADQGARFEADYEFLRGLLGFSVGTRDSGSQRGCHGVYSSARERELALPATLRVLQVVKELTESMKIGIESDSPRE